MPLKHTLPIFDDLPFGKTELVPSFTSNITLLIFVSPEQLANILKTQARKLQL